jgi:uncharacterized protein
LAAERARAARRVPAAAGRGRAEDLPERAEDRRDQADGRRGDLVADADGRLREVLGAAKTIAVIGISDDPSRASFGVSRYLQRSGYRILPVNPNVAEVHGEEAYPSLEALPEPPDVINVFRRSEHVAGLVEPAIASGAKLFWTQLGVRDDEAAKKLEAAGMTVVQDRCLMIEHMRLTNG